MEKVIEELNYKPNAIVRSLVCRSSNTIGIIANDLTNPFYTMVIDGIEKYLNDQGFTFFLNYTRYIREKEQQYLSQMIEKRVDGIIVINPNSYEGALLSEIRNTLLCSYCLHSLFILT